MRRLQLVLILDAAAALIVVAGAFSVAIRIACLAVMVVCAWATEPERELPGGGWWVLLAAGTLLAIAGFVVAEPLDSRTIGGLLALAGSGMTVVAAAVGFPLSPRRDR